MARLKYYQNERVEFPQEFNNKITIKEADSVIRKLIRHYKLDNYNNWSFVGVKSSRCFTRHGKSPYFDRTIKGWFKFSKTELSIGVICHELAHAIETNKRGKSTHAGTHFKIMKRLINYCRKMGYGKSQDIILVCDGRERKGKECLV